MTASCWTRAPGGRSTCGKGVKPTSRSGRRRSAWPSRPSPAWATRPTHRWKSCPRAARRPFSSSSSAAGSEGHRGDKAGTGHHIPHCTSIPVPAPSTAQPCSITPPPSSPRSCHPHATSLSNPIPCHPCSVPSPCFSTCHPQAYAAMPHPCHHCHARMSPSRCTNKGMMRTLHRNTTNGTETLTHGLWVGGTQSPTGS